MKENIELKDNDALRFNIVKTIYICVLFSLFKTAEQIGPTFFVAVYGSLKIKNFTRIDVKFFYSYEEKLSLEKQIQALKLEL